MNRQEKFREIYQRLLNENIFDMEKYRNEVKTQSIQKGKLSIAIIGLFALFIIIMIIIMITILIINVSTKVLPILLGLIAIMSFVFTFIICLKGFDKIGPPKERQYREKFKSTIIKNLIQSFDKTLEYEPRNFILQDVYEQAEFARFQWYWSEDLVYGNITNNCKLTMAEVHTWVTHDDDSITVFEGLFAKIETPKIFNEAIYIRKNKEKVRFTDLKIQLDSEEFEKIFDVYSSNKITAMQLLTSDIMQKLIDFYNETKTLFEITIKENYIYMQFYCGKLFEIPNIEQFSLDKENLYKYYEILDFTFEISNMLVNLIDNTQYE